jgi:zinc transport system permease protein
MEFPSALSAHAFLRYALAAGLLAAVGCGLIGPFVVVRRISSLTGAIAHAVLGGMGIALYLGRSPLAGAVVAAVAAALLIGWIGLVRKEREDALIGAIWATGMAVGVVFIAKTPGYDTELLSYLFGSILMVDAPQLQGMLVLDAVIATTVVLLYRPLVAVSFDEEMARLRGLPVVTLQLLLLVLVSLTVVLLIRVAGLVLVLALLTLPSAAAGHWARSLAGMMAVATLFGAVASIGGLWISYGPDLPAGATIVLTAAALFLASLAIRSLRDRFGPRADR